MTSLQDRPPAIGRFYAHLDKQIVEELIPGQKEGVERVLLATTLTSRHQIDIRRNFPFSNKRHYLVFSFGRDLRRRRRQESTLSRMLLTFLLLIAVLFVTCCILLILYTIKSVLDINVFRNFHVGIWDWWLSLKDRQH